MKFRNDLYVRIKAIFKTKISENTLFCVRFVWEVFCFRILQSYKLGAACMRVDWKYTVKSTEFLF